MVNNTVPTDEQLNNRKQIEFDWNNEALRVSTIGSLVTEAYDYLELTYVSAGNGVGEIETVVYKTGGSSGTTVATLTLTYNSDNNISSVTRS